MGSDGRIDGKGSFLEMVRSGVVTHDVMESQDMDCASMVTLRSWSDEAFREGATTESPST